jgi:hypothetical protein
MESLVQDRPALIPAVGEASSGPAPPGAENVTTLIEIVGIGIFLAIIAPGLTAGPSRRANICQIT